jgi:hypothetical protein
MTIKTFASKHRLRTKTDDCGERIIPGRVGQIYYHGDGKLGVLYMPDPDNTRPDMGKGWGYRKAQLEVAGCEIHQDCDGEGSAPFDPKSRAQVRVAIKVSGVRPKRFMSDEQREKCTAVLEKHRKQRS